MRMTKEDLRRENEELREALAAAQAEIARVNSAAGDADKLRKARKSAAAYKIRLTVANKRLAAYGGAQV